MSKLVAEEGKIKKQNRFVADTFTVSFKRTAIATTGDLGEVTISDINEEVIRLTYAQAISLEHEILRRCQ